MILKFWVTKSSLVNPWYILKFHAWSFLFLYFQGLFFQILISIDFFIIFSYIEFLYCNFHTLVFHWFFRKSLMLLNLPMINFCWIFNWLFLKFWLIKFLYFVQILDILIGYEILRKRYPLGHTIVVYDLLILTLCVTQH